MLLPFLVSVFFRKPAASLLIITPDLKKEYALGENQLIPVSGEYPLTVEIKDRKVRIISSTCPTGRCRHSAAEYSGDAVICAPNRTALMIVGSEGIDAYTE